MAKSRLIGDYPVIGIRPTIDGRRGPLKVRESLEVQTGIFGADMEVSITGDGPVIIIIDSKNK